MASGVSDGAIKILTSLDTSGIKSGLSKMTGLISKGMGAIAKSITAATGISSGSIVGLVGAGLKFASELESGMAKASTLVDTTTEEGVRNLAEMEEAFKKTSSEIGQSAASLAEAGYQALSAGVAAEDAGEFVDKAAKLATGGFTDTAAAVDLMTTAINAYGLDAKDAQHISDTLIMTQNKGKTTVGELASSLGRVAPAAAAMNVKLEDTEAALAQMTKGGISTAESCTYLKGMINELGKDGTKVSTILKEKTGKSFADLMKDGNSLGDVLDILSDSVDNDTTAFANLWQSQEAGTGALSIVNQGTKDYNETLEAIAGTAGATEDAVAKMTDTAEGKMNILKESAKNLGMSIVENLKDKFKEAIDAGIGYVDELKAAFDEDGLAGVVSKAGEIFAEIVARAAQEAPKIVDAAVAMIQNFVKGIADHKDEILQAAGQIVETLVTGIADLLPAEIGNPIKDMVKTIKESLQDGSLKKAIHNVIDFFKKLATAIVNVAKKVLPSFLKLIEVLTDHLDVLIPIILGVVAALKLLSIIQQIINLLETFAASFAVLQTVITALSGPVGILIALIGGLVAGLSAFFLLTRDGSHEVNEFSQRLADEAEVIREVQAARDEEIQNANVQWNYYDQLWNELQGIVDENGKIKEGYEERAAFITGELSKATGIEIEIVDGVIQKYGELKNEILGVMEVKKAEAMLHAYEDSYDTALREKGQAIQDLTVTYNSLREAEDAQAAAQARYDAALEAHGEKWFDLSREGDEIRRSLELANGELETASTNYDNASFKLTEYTSTIKNYETAMGDVAAESENTTISTLKLANGFISAENATKDALHGQLEAAQENLEALRQMVESGNTAITEQQIRDAEDYVAICALEFYNAGEVSEQQMAEWQNRLTQRIADSGIAQAQAAETSVRTCAEAQVNAMNTSYEEVADAADNTYNEAVQEGISRGSDETIAAAEEQAGQITDAAAAGYEAGADELSSTVETTTSTAISTGMEEAQAPKSAETMSKEVCEGIINTLGNYGSKIMTAGTALAHALIRGMNALGAPGLAGNIAHETVRGFFGPLDNAVSDAESKGRSLGANYMIGVANGIDNYVGRAIDAARTAVNRVVQAGNAAAEVRSPSKKGEYTGRMYDTGVAVGVEKNADLPVVAVEKMAERFLSQLDVLATGERLRAAVGAETQRVSSLMTSRMLASGSAASTYGDISQTVNIYQPVKTPVETARELKKAGRELAFAYG